jgi:hypothetical protein
VGGARGVLHAAHPVLGDGVDPGLHARSKETKARLAWACIGTARKQQAHACCSHDIGKEQEREWRGWGSTVLRQRALASAGDEAEKKWVWAPQATLNTQPAFLGLSWELERST